MPATIRDVARACGVHVSTVSRTFSAPNLVNPETRGRVLATAEHLGYRPNRAARALITGRTTNLGLIVADIANPYFPPMIKAAQSQARLRDHHVFVADTDEDPAVEEELVRALATQVDGIVLCSPRMSNSAIEVLAREVPLVVVNRVVADLPTVVMDDLAYDCQPQACAIRLPGADEWIKESVADRSWNTGTVVGNAYNKVLIVRLKIEFDLPRIAGRGFAGI